MKPGWDVMLAYAIWSNGGRSRLHLTAVPWDETGGRVALRCHDVGSLKLTSASRSATRGGVPARLRDRLCAQCWTEEARRWWDL